MRKIGNCGLCGEIAELTFEHVPPKAAFNNRGVLLADLQRLWLSEDTDPRKVRRHKSPRGAGAETLCEPCNKKTGGLYGNAYVDWAVQGMRFRYAAPKGSSLQLPFHILPARIGKQILCMFASACGPGLFEKAQELRRYVLNRDDRGIPNKFRIYCYLMAQRSTATRQAGITGLIADKNIHTFAEIAFPPFGYILTIDTRPVDRELADLTYFTQFGFHNIRSEYIRVPVREVNSYFPGDFRTVEEWNSALDNAKPEGIAA